MKNTKRTIALTDWRNELEKILTSLMPVELTPGSGRMYEPDFRNLKIPSLPSHVVESAIDVVKDHDIKEKLAKMARRLESDLTDFDVNKRRFREECQDIRICRKRQADGTLSDAPEALKQLRRNLKADIEFIKHLIDGKGVAEVSANKSIRVERAKGMTDKIVAELFNSKAQPLVRKVIKNNGYEKGEFTSHVKESRDNGEKGGYLELFGGHCVFEPQRGGDKSGYAQYGRLSPRGFRKWIKEYPNESRRQPDCGFHAGLLQDPAALEECARIWGAHCKEYSKQFYEWRTIHRNAPRGQFRFTKKTVIHGAEKTAKAP